MSAWGRAGVDEKTYNQFLQDLAALNKQYEGMAAPLLQNVGFTETEINEYGSGASTNPFLQQGAREGSDSLSQMQSQFTKDYQALAEKHGVQTTVVDDDKIYSIDPGNPFSALNHGVNPYDDFNPSDGYGQPDNQGNWNRDSRTSSYQFKDFLFDVVPSSPEEILQFAVSAGMGGQGYGLLDGASDVKKIVDTARDGSDDHAKANQDFIRNNFTGGQTANGAMVDLGETEGPANSGPLDGLLGNSGISIPIPGLPISLPGNMDIGSLMDIAKATGRSVMDVIRDMGGEDAPAVEEVNEEDNRINGGGLVLGREPISDPVGDSEEEEPGLTLGQPPGWEGNIQEPFPGSPPPQEVNENPETPIPSLVAGETGGTPSNSDIAAGLGLLLPGLLALNQNDPAPTPEYEMWDYIGPDSSYGYETPDYGQVTQKPLYEFAQQPSQPTQVGYQPDPRRDFLNVLEQEQKRRQQTGLLG